MHFIFRDVDFDRLQFRGAFSATEYVFSLSVSLANSTTPDFGVDETFIATVVFVSCPVL